MDDYKDFWVVIGTAGPVMVVAILVVVGQLLPRSTDVPRTLLAKRIGYLCGSIAFVANGFLFLVSLGNLSAGTHTTDVWERGFWRTIAFYFMIIGFAGLFFATVMAAAAQQTETNADLRRKIAKLSFKSRRRS